MAEAPEVSDEVPGFVPVEDDGAVVPFGVSVEGDDGFAFGVVVELDPAEGDIFDACGEIEFAGEDAQSCAVGWGHGRFFGSEALVELVRGEMEGDGFGGVEGDG